MQILNASRALGVVQGLCEEESKVRIHNQVPGGNEIINVSAGRGPHLVRTLDTRRHVYTVLSDNTLVVPFAYPYYHSRE